MPPPPTLCFNHWATIDGRCRHFLLVRFYTMIGCHATFHCRRVELPLIATSVFFVTFTAFQNKTKKQTSTTTRPPLPPGNLHIFKWTDCHLSVRHFHPFLQHNIKEKQLFYSPFFSVGGRIAIVPVCFLSLFVVHFHCVCA